MSHLANLALDVPVDLYLGLLSNLLDVTAQVGGDDRTRSNQTLGSLRNHFYARYHVYNLQSSVKRPHR